AQAIAGNGAMAARPIQEDLCGGAVHHVQSCVKERLHSRAASLSGGEQKQLEIGRALLLRPKVILIDEPSIGLSPMVVLDVFKLLRRLADQGTTVLMVEQNVKSALAYSDDAIALESGRLVLHRPAAEILSDPHMERLFLGGAHTTGAPQLAATD
ncbi:MAG: ATP-binding cassette domain-containing protein, partial [Curvibacter sp.]